MKKFSIVILTLGLFLQFLLPLAQVPIVQAEETGQMVGKNTASFTSVETQDYMDSESYERFGLRTLENAPKTFDADDGNNPLLGLKQDHFDEIYLGDMNKSTDFQGEFVVKESLLSEKEFVLDDVRGSKNLILEEDILEVDEESEENIIGKENELERVSETDMLFNNDPELFCYMGHNVIGFVGEQRTRITESLEKLSNEEKNIENQKSSIEEKTAINKGYSEQVTVKNEDGSLSTEIKGQVSRLNTEDLFFKDQPEYIFESVLYYGKYNGGLTSEDCKKNQLAEPISGMRLTAYKVNNEKKKYEPIGQPIVKKLGNSRNESGKDYLEGLDYQDSIALTALAKGDYDKDGIDEVAVYIPDAGTKGPYIAFFETREGKLQEKIWKSTGQKSEILLENIDLKFGMKEKDSNGSIQNIGKWKDEFMPSVHLHTTQVANKDQLVISTTMPRREKEPYKGINHNNILAIYDYQPNSKNTDNKTEAMQKVGGNFHLKSGDVRMQFASTTDGDIDGDGKKELVVIGYKESDYDKDEKRYGKIHDTDLYIQVIKPTIKQPEEKEEKETGINQSINFSYYNANFNKITSQKVKKRELMPPIAMDMGVMDDNPDTASREFLFVNGTLARHDPDNKKDSVPEYSFEVLDNLDMKKYSGTTGLVYRSVYFARLLEDSTRECIMVLHSDWSIADDINIHPSILSVDGKNKIAYQSVSKKYLNKVDEDDHGTFVTFRPINADRDTTYYKYVGKEAGWSKPTVLSIIPAAPMWEELDYKMGEQSLTYIPSVSYMISNGEGDGSDGYLNIGGSIAYQGILTLARLAADATLGWSKSESETLSLTYTHQENSDGMILFSTPKTIYKYKRFKPRKIVTEEFLESEEYMLSDNANLKVGDVIKGFISDVRMGISGAPILSTSNVAEFNQNAEKANSKLDEEDKIELIDMEAITQQKARKSNKLGNPFTFPEMMSDLQHPDENKKYENLFVLNEISASQLISTDKKLNAALALDSSSSMSEGFAISFSRGLHVGIPLTKIDLATEVNYSGGASWIQTSTHGETFTYDVPSFPKQDFPGIDIDESGYNFVVTPAMFRTSAYKNIEVEDMDEATKDEMKALKLDPEDLISPLVLTHLVGSPDQGQSTRDHRLPPALPKNLRLANRQYKEEVVGSGENAKTKTRVLATIAWDLPNYLPKDAPNISEDRFPSYYQVYSRVVDERNPRAWSIVTDDSSLPLKIPGKQNFATFYIEDQIESREYKLQSVYHANNNVKLESVTTPAFAVDGLNLDYDPIFTQQPRDFWASEEKESEESGSEESETEESESELTPHFSAKFHILDSKKAVYEWQRFTEDGIWEPVSETSGETIADPADGTVSLRLLELPETVTHYRLNVKSNDIYSNSSNIVNYYPADSQSVKLDVDVLDTDSMRVTETENEDKIHYQAGLVTAEEDGKVVIQTKVTDKDNTRVTSGTVYLRVDGDVKDSVELTDNVATEKQGITEFELSLEKMNR